MQLIICLTFSRTFTCTGSYKTSTGTVVCNGVHGTVNFEKALNRSCNSAFAQIAEELGNENLTATAERLGFNKRIQLDGKINVAKSYFTLNDAVSVDRGWAGIGQYKTLQTPCIWQPDGAIIKRNCPMPHVLTRKRNFSLTIINSAIYGYNNNQITL